MPCNYPLQAYSSASGPVFKRSESSGTRLDLPCGQCQGCRIDKSREWAIRLMHELQSHEDNGLPSSFVTLTYENDPISLQPKDFTLFLKRLRKSIAPQKLRYFMCGEYGDQLGRPHYHAILFGYYPDDCVLLRESEGVRLYDSDKLAALWGHGHVSVGSVTFQSAAYVARYSLKKVTGNRSIEHYRKLDPYVDYYHPVQPEFARMSNRPGIGAHWLSQFSSDVFPHDFCVHDGRKIRTPRYYTNRLQVEKPEQFKEIKKARIKRQKELSEHNTYERREARAKILESKLSLTTSRSI